LMGAGIPFGWLTIVSGRPKTSETTDEVIGVIV
jgi:hypothetical protein